MIKIVTDSTAYLPAGFVQKHDIRVVPLYVRFGNDMFREGVELSTEAFYERLRTAPELPSTSQPSAGEFHQVFEKLVDAGHEILVLTISSKLSGTWNSAMAARDMLPEASISVVDSLSASVGLHLQIAAAASAVAAGRTREEIVEEIEGIKGRLSVLFVVDTLEYLAKGGRIGGAKALLGTVLRIKPILALREGAIEPLEQVRSRRKALDRLLDLVVEYAGDQPSRAHVAVSHALVPKEAEAVSQEIASRLGCGEPLFTHLGPVIGTHTGPGCIAVAVYS